MLRSRAATTAKFVTIVLEQSPGFLRTAINKDQRWNDIHLKRLDFKTIIRPARRHLYLTTVLTLIRRKRYSVPGWQHDEALLRAARPKNWVTPGPWLRNSRLLALAAEVGHEGIVDAGEMADFTGSQRTEREETKLALEFRYLFEGGDEKYDELHRLLDKNIHE